jgi:DNA-binding transcriptional ArsR family regulator
MTASYDADVAPIASLIGEPTRAAILSALMSGTAHAAGELARHAGVSPATASSHLGRLLDGGLVTVEKQGRHRYYRLSSTNVAAVLEALAHISPRVPPVGLRQVRASEALRRARSCYDHLAGWAGVALYQSVVDQGWLSEGGTTLARSGEAALEALGVDINRLRHGRRPLVRSCLDWTERRPHLAGAVGAALLTYALDRQWLGRIPGQPRALRITDEGEYGLAAAFGLDPAGWSIESPSEAARTAAAYRSSGIAPAHRPSLSDPVAAR